MCGIEQSSNVGFSKISLQLGSERFYKYARDFGFGIYNGVELPGENKGLLKRPVDFSSVSLPYMSIGYEVLVNAMQISNAYAAIANKGTMMKSYIVKKEFGNNNNIIFEAVPTTIRQVVSEKTASILTSLFTGVVERGTGTDAKIEGISIAGKTGTAQRLVNGEYSNSSHNSSFVGYFPADNPQMLITVILNNPKSGEYYGGKVAAPIFKNIANRIINFTGKTNIASNDFVNVNYSKSNINVQELSDLNDRKILIPNLVNLKLEDAKELLTESNIKFEIIDSTDTKSNNNENGNPVITKFVESQLPIANEKIIWDENLKVRIVVRNSTVPDDRLVIVPEVKNLSLRKAINLLLSGGFDVFINGSGKILEQSPLPGTKQLPGCKIILYCKNQ